MQKILDLINGDKMSVQHLDDGDFYTIIKDGKSIYISLYPYDPEIDFNIHLSIQVDNSWITFEGSEDFIVQKLKEIINS